MTIDEVSQRYNIPLEILREYESWGLTCSKGKVKGDWQYDDEDIELLSMVMTLRDIGFDAQEREAYMKLLSQGESSRQQRLAMLNKHRKVTLDEIHLKETQLEQLDYLRYSIKTTN